jgi:hypothetical protein
MKGLTASLKFVTVVAAVLVVGCGKSADSFSLLADGSTYKQSAVYVPRKVDVLWVIDNSGSMASSQANLASHFQAFIAKFQQSDSDFHMAVTTTDAYLAPYSKRNSTGVTTFPYADFNRIRDGVTNVDMSQHSGVFVITKTTADLQNVFIKNITQGTKGSGDERALSSFEETLKNSWNSAFRRPDAFLAVIIVSDEDDFSHNDLASVDDTYLFSESYTGYTDPRTNVFVPMTPIQHYVDYLASLTTTAGSGKNFSVNAISIFDQNCLDQLQNGQQKLNQRYSQLVDATGGQKISLCSDFSQSLQSLSQSIVELTSAFALSRIPNVSTIVVTVDGASVANSATNGWTYDSASNSIVFHGAALPQNGANVAINFDPAGVKN